jgi:hypothetical protein
VNAERLKVAGLAVSVETEASSDAPLLRIEQSGDSVIHAGTRAGMALAIYVRIVVLKSGITIRDCEITIPGWSARIFLVELQDNSLNYQVLGWLDLQTDAVLNHRIFSGRPLPLGRNLDGFLVAQSFDPLPSQAHSGMPISAQVRFADELGNFFTSEVQLRVEWCKQERSAPQRTACSSQGKSSPLATSSKPAADGQNRRGKQTG